MMTPDQAKLLLTSLLNRIASDRARYLGLVSDQEIEALSAFSAAPAQSPIAPAESKSVPQLPPLDAQPQVALQSVGAAIGNPDVVLCIDFGTAKSKAFAARDTGEGDPDLFDLGIGVKDGDIDGAVFSAASALWISDGGRIFVGSEAIRQSEIPGLEGRARIDSIKQFLSQSSSPLEVSATRLSAEEDPFRSGLTREHALLLYLGYLTDLSGTCLGDRSLSRLVPRRFALPCWRDEQRAWAADYLAGLVARAQIVADTFRGRWQAGLGIREAIYVCDATKEHEGTLRVLIDAEPDLDLKYVGRWGGILEPIASASARVHADRKVDRRLMLVVDIGAGTTDVAMFWLVQDEKGHRAFPVSGTTTAMRIAGDHLDQILLKLLLDKGNVEERMRQSAERKLKLEGLRRIKELLFRSGSVTVRMPNNDALVSVTLTEFEAHPDVIRFREQLSGLVASVIKGLHPSWAPHAERITLVLSGGGAALPAALDLANLEIPIGDRIGRFRLAPSKPDGISPELADEYPRLAVAFGGAISTISERSSLFECPAGSPAHGQLERSQNRGI